MSPEHVQENVEAEAPLAGHFVVSARVKQASSHRNVTALKFGGSSLLGAERMSHAAGLVRAAARCSNVIVVVSAMKGVTDLLLAISRSLAQGKTSHARNEAEGVIHLHFNVLQDLQLAEEQHDRVLRSLQLLARDLLHEVPLVGRVAATAELADRLDRVGSPAQGHRQAVEHRILPEVVRELPELQQAKTTSLNPIDIFRCLRLKVWDVESQRMIGLREIKTPA